jgi:hypothetical protein
VPRSCEHEIELLRSIKGGEFLDQLNEHQVTEHNCMEQIGSQMAVKLSAIRARPALPPERSSGTQFRYRSSNPWDHGAAGRIR